MISYLVTFALLVRADLPVHCTQPEVMGSWVFHVGTYHLPNGDVDPNCGFIAPDNHRRHRHLTPPVRDPSKKEMGEYWLSDSFKEKGTIRVDLSSTTSKVMGVSKSLEGSFDNADLPNGDWTMVYDEGFQVSMIGDKRGSPTHSFFAFSKYVLNAEESNKDDFTLNGANSDCSTTLLGWYKTFRPNRHDAVKNMCWWGQRVSDLEGIPVTHRIHEKPVESINIAYWGLLAVAVAVYAAWHCMRPSPAPRHAGTWSPWYGSSSDAPPFSPKKALSAGNGTITRKSSPAQDANKIMWYTIAGLALIMLGYAVLHYTRQQGWIKSLAVTSRSSIGDVAKHYRAMPNKRWKTQTPRAFAKFIREKSKHMDVSLTEHSTMQALADHLRPRTKILPGFASEENIGPVTDTRGELRTLAEELGVPVTALTWKMVQEAWGEQVAGHLYSPVDHEFYDKNMKLIHKDEWHTLTAFGWHEVTIKTANKTYGPNFIPEAVNQGSCGACFSVASTTMYTSRAMIQHPELLDKFKDNNDRLSWRYPLECNVYTQGCDGGYPFIVSRWASENDLVTDQCLENNGMRRDENGACYVDKKNANCQDRFRVRDFRYIGGALGRCGFLHLCEEMIREELFKGGPLAAAMIPDDGFFSYSSGIMHETQANSEKTMDDGHAASHQDCKTHECFKWSKVDHSVVLVGWGAEDSPSCWRTASSSDGRCDGLDAVRCKKVDGCSWSPFPYWVAQNSWGPTWGENGLFKIGPRGYNPMHIESLTVAADVEFVSRAKGANKRSPLKEIVTTYKH